MAKKTGSQNNFIKNGVYVYDRATYEKPGTPPKKEIVPVIKWHQVEMTFEEKQRFNLLTYQDIIQHQMEEAQAAQAAEASQVGGTFWQSDTSERKNLSQDEYSAFIEQNDLNLSNSTTMDIGSICSSVETAPEEPVAAYEPTEEEILANVYRDIHGEASLTPEEIAALFAAANN